MEKIIQVLKNQFESTRIKNNKKKVEKEAHMETIRSYEK